MLMLLWGTRGGGRRTGRRDDAQRYEVLEEQCYELVHCKKNTVNNEDKSCQRCRDTGILVHFPGNADGYNHYINQCGHPHTDGSRSSATKSSYDSLTDMQKTLYPSIRILADQRSLLLYSQ